MKQIKTSLYSLIILGLIFFPSYSSPYNLTTYSNSNEIGATNENIPLSSQTKKKWTVMVYLDGDNNLEEAAINDLNEMEMIGSSSEVDIVVQFDRINGYDDSNGDLKETYRYYVEKDTSQTEIGNPVDVLGEVNMGSSISLESFIIWSQTNYPSENYALILWDHGSGPMWGPYLGGICWDDTDDQDFLTQDEIASAISGKNIDLLGMDACLMGSAEVIFGLHEYVDVFVASEENEPGDGWAYDIFLQELISNPSMSAETLGQVIVQGYYDFYLPYIPYGWEVTQSALQADKIANVVQSLSSLAGDLIDQISGFRSSIETIRSSLHNYGDSPYIDLYEFLDKLEEESILPTEIAFIKSSIESAVILSKYTGSLSESHGITIYFPKIAEDFSNIYTTSRFGQDTLWDEFLLSYYSAPVGDDQFEENDLLIDAKRIRFKEYVGLICNDTDYYKFNVSAGDELSVSLEYTHVIDVSDLNLFLYAENESLIEFSSTQTSSELVSWVVDSNQTVSVKINNTYGNGYMSMYSLSASIPIEDDMFDVGDGNNNFTTATELNNDLLDNNETFSDLVCINPDYYNFSLFEISADIRDAYVTVELEYIATEGFLGLDIILIRSSTKTVIQSINTPDDNAIAKFTAENYVGFDYYIIVSNYENNSNYNLSVFLDYELDDQFDNKTFDNDFLSLSADIPRSNQIYYDLVCIDDDFYNISLVENEWLNVSIFFKNSMGDLDLYLYGPHSNLSSEFASLSSSYFWEDNEMITFRCPENGTYAIQVYPREMNLNYNMSIIVNETGISNDVYDTSNNHWDQLENFPEITVNSVLPDLAAWDDDYYNITLDKNEKIVISAIYDGSEGTLAISLYDISGNEILTQFNHLYYSAVDEETYIIKIIPLQRISEYILMVVDEPDLSVDFSSTLTSSLEVELTELVDLTGTVDLNFYVDYFIWDFGDGSHYLGTNANLTHLYDEPGHYPVSLTVWTKYGKGMKYTEYVDVFSTPEDGFLIYLNGTNPLSNSTFTIYWEPITNAQTLSIYYTVSNSTPVEDWALLQEDSSGNGISITLTMPQSGKYYFVVKYSNPFGTAVSEVLLVEIQLDSGTDTGGGDIGLLDFIPGFNSLIMVSSCFAVCLYLILNQKKRE
ncbi:clostripain-related cysteine peptidase [Candidatus Lokiarchaeum ossiferum]|uniref:clostripain-related cysteine peptidase n=1 Tax=Candidatus Lokiarchaeum ossiferum TaxID=2951803 RepID=UPI00352F1735